MEKFTLAIKFTAKPDNYVQFKDELISLFDKIQHEENFIRSIIHQNIEKPEEFFVYEEWNGSIEIFLNTRLEKPYAIEWEELLVKMQIEREPSVYQALAHYIK